MKNKFDTELVQANVFTRKPETPVAKAKEEKKTARVSSKRYTQMMDNLDGEATYGVNCKIPLSYYRRMRDYKDLHKEESFQSIVLTAIMEWIDRNA